MGGDAGEGRADGDLVHVAAVEDLDVERGQQGFADAGRGVGEQAGNDGQQVQQRQVVVLGAVGLEGCELGFGAGALVVQLGVAGADPGAVRLGGRVARVGGVSSSVIRPCSAASMRARSARRRASWRARALRAPAQPDLPGHRRQGGPHTPARPLPSSLLSWCSPPQTAHSVRLVSGVTPLFWLCRTFGG
jgi:hypothetical protein